MDSCVNLDPSVFPYQDIRYTGKETGTKPKTKKGVKLAPIVIKPKVTMPGGVVVPKPIGGESTIEGPNSGVSPLSGSGGTAGGSMGGDSSCSTPTVSNIERIVVKYTPSVDNKGMCFSYLVVYCLCRW